MVFLLTASTNNSLSSKNAALAVFLLLMFCLHDVKIREFQKTSVAQIKRCK
jgi:hypothetical protein